MTATRSFNHRSIAYVYVSQSAAALFPLLVAPLIVRDMGIGSFGFYAVLMMCAQGGATISEYSFDAYGPRILASEDGADGDSTYWDVFCNKLVLFPIAILIASLSAWSLSGAHFDLITLAGICLYVVGIAIHASWFLIATGQTGVLAASMLVGRVLALVAVGAALYLDVANPSVLLLATSLGVFVGGLVAFAFNRSVNLHGGVLRPRSNLLPSGWRAFVGVAGAFLQNFLGQAIAWWSGGAVGAGLYAAVDRLARAVSAGLKPLFSVAYPRLVRLHRDNPARAWRAINRAAIVWVGISIAVLSFAWILSDQILELFYGKNVRGQGALLLLIVSWLCVGVLNNIYGIQGVLASGMDLVFARAMWLGIGATVLAALLLNGSLFGALLAATAVLVGESMIFVYYGFTLTALRRKRAA